MGTADAGTAQTSRRARVVWSVRSRILLWYVLLMSVAIVASVLVVQRVLTVQVDRRIDDQLVQEMNELRKLARGRDPDTGQRFRGDVERIFEVFLQRNIPAGDADPSIVRLAQNAAQHTGIGASISLGSAIANGEARLWVRDSGPGIPADQQANIFRRFARGAGGRRSDGAGIGLSIVKVIAEAHHGRVQVLSRPSVGSTFTVVIPTDQPVKEVR